MSYAPENALIVQSDRSVRLEVHSPHAEAASAAIAPYGLTTIDRQRDCN